MAKLQPARGTRDIYGEDARRMRLVADTFFDIAARYGFEEIQTPIFEFTDVFARPLGESSDIVSKEMYSFEDRGGEGLTLRPELTAGIARAFISEGMQQNLPCRFASVGAAFRYERPQKGRYRQFHQIDCEWLGGQDPHIDVEVMALGADLLKALGLYDKIELQINSLGDSESRARYREALVSYYEGHKDGLSDDSQRRLSLNPLRILDSKDEGDIAINQGAPRLTDHFNDLSADYFDGVKKGLDALGIEYVVNHRLVRGMDYYCHTAFEFVTTQLGAQGTVIGGGRYDGLIKTLGGPDTPGVGFGGGLERIAMLLSETPSSGSPVMIFPMGGVAENEMALHCAATLRGAGLTALIDRTGNLGKRLKRADGKGARFAAIIGDSEVASRTVTLRDLKESSQQEVALADLTAKLKGMAS